MATTVYDVEEIELQNGAKAKLKPLSIKELRKFMAAIQKTNVADLLNKSVGDVAYNIIDLDAAPQASLLEKIRALKGVINLRLIEGAVG